MRKVNKERMSGEKIREEETREGNTERRGR